MMIMNVEIFSVKNTSRPLSVELDATEHVCPDGECTQAGHVRRHAAHRVNASHMSLSFSVILLRCYQALVPRFDILHARAKGA